VRAGQVEPLIAELTSTYLITEHTPAAAPSTICSREQGHGVIVQSHASLPFQVVMAVEHV